MPAPAPDPTRNPHPLLPDGSFQGRRLPAALADGYVQVDGKADTDWVEFVRLLASEVNFVDAQNTVTDNWSPFYEKQAAVAAARLLAWPLEQLGRRFAEHRELIEDRQGTLSVDQLLDSLFDLLSSAVVALDRLTDRFPVGTPLRERAEALIAHQLAPAYGRWLAYHRAGAPVYFAALGADAVPDYLRDAYAAGGSLIATQDVVDGTVSLNPRWTGGLSWADHLAAIGTDEVVYGATPTAANAGEQILHAVGHAFFHGVYELFVSSALHLRAAARSEWERLQTDPGNAPHLALLLAYLRMRERQRAMLNGLTDRHLNFYYQRVLRTLPAPARPPRAFLTLEARKNLPATYLPAGTAFRGGKDEATGTERTFLNTGAVTVSLATVAEKRAVFKVADDPSVYDFPNENRKVFATADAGRLFAARVVDSGDGTGEAELPEEQNGWYPFGQQAVSGGHLIAGMEEARVGLAIASHYLYLREGTRTITFEFADLDPLPAYPGVEMKVLLTTEEGWHEVEATLQEQSLTVALPPEAPAIVAYAEEVHQQGLATSLPVARLELPQTAGSLTNNLLLRHRTFSRVYIGVDVKGVRQLALSGSAGVVDPSKPFHPFGAAPRKGDVLIIGHKESFQKEFAEVTPRWTWADATGATSVNVDQYSRQGGSWHHERSFSLNDGNFTDYFGNADRIVPDFSADAPFAVGATGGFLKLTLTGDWGHAAYPAALTDWAAKKANGETVGAVPAAPFNPLFAELSLDYLVDHASANVRNAQEGSHQLFHLTPFGSDPLPATGTRTFLPNLLPQSGDAVGADAGALYLGIEQWEAGSQLSLLFQIAEGTADPLLEKPEDHVRWHYLKDNQWVTFPNDKLSDGTEGLLRTGLVRLDLPAGTRAENARFNDARQWIRLSVAEKVNAVNRLLGVHAHGVEVAQAFTAGQSAANTPLPPGTVTKLALPRPGIKKVEQPYSTFGGAAPENRDTYFTRLSERLRHKNRGITEWDIEHLVLGAFPEVERVICLQHLQFAPRETPGTYDYHELRAGHFTVLPLGRSGEEGLRPYVSLSTREAIEAFLHARITCHATLHVRNPLFEEVQVRADVRYLEGTDESWAQTQIQTDLIDYISPWYDEGLAGLDFSAEVHRSGVVNFLEELPYVDYVKNLVLLHLADPTQNGAERLRATKLVSVLASAPHHLITPLHDLTVTGPTEVCAPPRRRARRARVTVTENPID
ncbi:baseplate J/gp47 family protein [Neolewinella litorea]|uniref:Baseplate protein J-like domain-containing protein n=1 Tax=Neolewinella litorea TaxID=2562452 RepID=A0A4S4NKQ9_9BACT|nr:baseplate J/gp47 family protein [Neolewinella litorea]THH39407.1 hypothetical protein E4021_11680 [Neolewinella litorea]